MRILVASLHYRPDGGPSAPMFTMLCEELVRRGHQVTVLAAVPHYPTGYVPKEYRGKFRMESDENGVHVIRIGVPSVDRRNLAKRMAQFISYQIGAVIAGWNRDYDVYLTTTAALQMILPFTLLSVLRRKASVYSVHDVYPDVGVKSGIFRNGSIIHMVAGLEEFCFRHAACVRILSESFKPGLLSRGVPNTKINLIYDWIDTTLFMPLPRENAFALEHGLNYSFNVLYAGNIGMVQGLDSVLDAADLLKQHEDIRFVFVGDGMARKSLVEKTERLSLGNVKFIPYQPFEKMPQILASADVSLVSLVKGSGHGALPSKSFSIFASGRPVLASVDQGSETWKMVHQIEAGLCVPPESPAELANAVLTLRKDGDLRERLGRNGRKRVEQYHSPQIAAERFERLFSEAAECMSPH